MPVASVFRLYETIDIIQSLLRYGYRLWADLIGRHLNVRFLRLAALFWLARRGTSLCFARHRLLVFIDCAV
tara:strand:- start:82 stop:294 length:213 start_codon:yes stop_codon:yes gene_type:complete